jgi:hypothetical protein
MAQRHALARERAAAFDDLDVQGRGVGEESRAGGLCAREIGLQAALLGTVAAAVATEAGAHAPLGIDAPGEGGPSERARAVEDDPVVGGVRIVGDGARVEFRLEAREDRREVGGAHPFGPVIGGPFVEHPVGGAEHDHPVHRGAAAHARALQHAQRRIVGGPLAALRIQTGEHLVLALVEGCAVQERAGLHDEHLVAGLGEAGGGDGATRAGADDDGVRAQPVRIDSDRTAQWREVGRGPLAGRCAPLGIGARATGSASDGLPGRAPSHGTMGPRA